MTTYFATLEENARYRLLVADDDPDLFKVVQTPPWKLCEEHAAVKQYQEAAEMVTVFLLDTHISRSAFGDEPILDWLKHKGLANDAAKNHLLIMYSGEPFEHKAFFRAFAKSGRPDRDLERVTALMNLTVARQMDLEAWPRSLVSPPSTEYAQALRLLCEAWLLKKWAQSPNFAKCDELGNSMKLITSEEIEWLKGIELTPPETLDEWLGPFSPGGSVEAVVGKMPTTETKEAVQRFFTYLNGKGLDFAAVAELFLVLNRSGREAEV